MNRSRFTETQIVAMLREHEAGKKVADLCRKGLAATSSEEATEGSPAAPRVLALTSPAIAEHATPPAFEAGARPSLPFQE